MTKKELIDYCIKNGISSKTASNMYKEKLFSQLITKLNTKTLDKIFKFYDYNKEDCQIFLNIFKN